MGYAPEGELFDQVVKESEEKTLINQVTDFTRSVYSIMMENAPEGELYDQVVMTSEKAIYC